MTHELPSYEEVTSMRLDAKRFIPFHPIADGDADGFTPDGEEQRVEYPFHCNVPTRIYFDATRHDVLLQRDAEGQMSILIAPKEGVRTSSI